MNANLVNSEFRILTKDQIEFEVRENEIFSNPNGDSFGENYYYARIGHWFMKSTEGEPHRFDESNGTLQIKPYEYVILTSCEIFELPKNIFAFIGFRSHYIQKGLIPLAGSTIDPGYTGTLTLGFYNSSPLTIPVRFGEKICKLVFYKLGIPVTEGYKHPNKEEEDARRSGRIPPSIREHFSFLQEFERLTPPDRINNLESRLNTIDNTLNNTRNVLFVTAFALVIAVLGVLFGPFLK
jgi:deoxycytidine triphosphate deaminase